MNKLAALWEFALKMLPHAACFLTAFVLSLALTPAVRELARKCGMVDKPSGRRINKTPVPRGGGLAVFLAFIATAGLFFFFMGHRDFTVGVREGNFWRLAIVSSILVVTGLVDDKFGMPPRVKLSLQILAGLLTNLWLGIGFQSVFPSLPGWLDCALTTFWIVGAVNAFNLIDGLDGLAGGLAAIAVAGMAGSLFFMRSPGATVFHFAIVGALFGFLRYNFHPASVFLGDTGSMFLGYLVSTLPLVTRTGDSLLVGVGVPLLAMGVPIFDTSLAIVRRSVRAFLFREERKAEGQTRMMQPDVDHLHHRLLRKYASQKKVAWALYLLAGFLVLSGLGAVALRDRAAGLFAVTFIVAVVVAVRDMSRVELFDAGRLLDVVAHDATPATRRRRAALLVPMLMIADAALLVAAWVLARVFAGQPVTQQALHTFMPLTVAPAFVAVVLFKGYSTVWGRAQISNYLRLGAAVAVGTAASFAGFTIGGYSQGRTVTVPLLFAACACALLSLLRMTRMILRDAFYAFSARRLADDPSTTRVLVYGAGLRYRAFRRELVRDAARGRRFIVGIVDDDVLLKGHVIGGVKIWGPHVDAARIVAATRAQEVVIACNLTPERRAAAIAAFKKCGVRVLEFSFSEREV